MVIATYPRALDTLEDLSASVRFDFDERISERVSGGSLAQAISISPRVGDVKVKHGSRSLSVEVEGGFQAGIVYRVTLQPIVQDLFGNRLMDAFELVFSTGGELIPTTLAGQVWSRASGVGVNAATVLAVGTDGLTHESVTNREGIFAFRYLPAGSFHVTAFEDVNRDGNVDSTEVQGGVPADLAVGDTLLVDVPVLEPDTSAATVASAGVLDSLTIFVEFHDLLDPETPVDAMEVAISREDGGAPRIVRLFHEAGYAEYVDAVVDSFARLDSIDDAEAAAEAAAVAALNAARADSFAAADSAVAPDSVRGAEEQESATPEDTVVLVQPEGRLGVGAPQEAIPSTSSRVPPTRLDPLPGPRPGPTADGRRVLPGRRIVAQLSEPLVLDVEYEVRLSSVVNINGLPGGGGTAPLVWESPPPPDTLAAPDTLVTDTLVTDTLVTDTLAVPDTGVVDTLSVPDGGAGLRR